MTPPDFDFPGDEQRRPSSASGGSRPIPLASASGANPAGRPQSAAGSRPIVLKPKDPDALPGAFDDYDEEDEQQDDIRDVLRQAPAWLVSTVFHMLLLIVLGLSAVRVVKTNPKPEIEVGNNPMDEIGSQLIDETVLEGENTRVENPHDEMVITPKDLAPVDDPLAAPIEIGDLKIGAGAGPIAGPIKIEGAPIGLALKGRQIGTKNVLLGKYGGTAGTEAAVENGLAWLAKNQRSDGLWSLSGPYGDGSLSENTAAATAMALLAFQGRGDTHREGKYSKNVARAWTALLKLQRKDGLFTGAMSERTQLLYTHAQCAIALCELYGMTQDSMYRSPAERAIAYAVAIQDKRFGGWRYVPNEDSDTSVTGWFVMALQSARMAGLKVPGETFKRVTQYLDVAQIDDGRRYGYWLAQQETSATSAEGLLCRQYLGWRQDDPRLVEGVRRLVEVAPIAYDSGPNHDAYYWYYATQAAHHMEGKIWDDWNKVLRQVVPEHQVKAGPEAGSWNPNSDKWGGAGGRLYVTCLSIYMLEVYYRHLPIYSGYKFVEGVGATMNPDAGKAPADGDARGEKPAPPASPEAAEPDAKTPSEENADGAKKSDGAAKQSP